MGTSEQIFGKRAAEHPRPTVLLVEDDENDVFFFERAVQKCNLDNPVQVVRDGSEAMAYLSGEAPFADRSQHPVPELMILDLNLPLKNGLEVLKWVRTNPLLKRIIVVILTSSTSDLDMAEAYELGTNSYLVKPGDPDRLVEIVKLIKDYWIGVNRTPSKRRQQGKAD